MSNESPFEIHHRKPRSICQNKDEKVRSINKSKVRQNKHRAWHVLFGNMTAEAIAEEINNTWLDPDYIFIVKYKPK